MAIKIKYPLGGINFTVNVIGDLICKLGINLEDCTKR